MPAASVTAGLTLTAMLSGVLAPQQPKELGVMESQLPPVELTVVAAKAKAVPEFGAADGHGDRDGDAAGSALKRDLAGECAGD